MNRIVSIKLNAKESRYWLELDDGRRLGLSPAIYLESGYRLDDMIGSDEWQRLAQQEAKAQVRRRALTVLEFGDRSEAELRRKLQDADPELVDVVMGELRAMRLVDDRRYMEHVVDRHLRRTGWGKKKLAHELRRSGIAAHLIGAAVEMVDDDSELARASAWVERQARNRNVHDPAVIKRIYNGLVRRGFDHSIAQAAIRSLRDGLNG